MWKQAGVSREKFEEFILALPDETLQKIRDNAHADALLEGTFVEVEK